MALSSNADEAIDGVARDAEDDRGDSHPATMKQNLMTRRRGEAAVGETKGVSGSAP